MLIWRIGLLSVPQLGARAISRRGGSGVDAGWGRLRRPWWNADSGLTLLIEPCRVGAGVVWMLGGDACVALGGVTIRHHIVDRTLSRRGGGGVDAGWGRLRRPWWNADFSLNPIIQGDNRNAKRKNTPFK
jgi:hypothetical protein